MRQLLPEGWSRPNGYANAIEARGRFIFTAGLVGWNERKEFVAKDLAGQLEQILSNLVVLLAEGGARPEHVVRMTWYITDKQAYRSELARIGQIYRAAMGRVFPAMAVVVVSALIEDEALIEIETTAVVPIDGVTALDAG